MSRITVLLITKDRAWSKLLGQYVEEHHNTALRLIIKESFDSEIEWENTKTDAVLVDIDAEPLGVEIELIRKKHEPVHIIGLLSESGGESEANTIYKYLPADQLLQKIKSVITGKRKTENVKHYVFGSTEGTMLCYKAAELFCESVVRDGGSCVLISMGHPNKALGKLSNGVNDPFGRLIYYASVSEERVEKELDTLVVGASSGIYYVPKPYAFDASQCTNQVMDNLIKGLNNQGVYQTVVWHIGTAFSTGLAGLLQCSEKVFWFGSAMQANEDTVLDTYKTISGCRLDLKTHYEYKGSWSLISSESMLYLDKVLLNFSRDLNEVGGC